MSRSGHNVVFHCKGGLGRAGTLCACTMVALGHAPQEAIVETRKIRKRAIGKQHARTICTRLRSVSYI